MLRSTNSWRQSERGPFDGTRGALILQEKVAVLSCKIKGRTQGTLCINAGRVCYHAGMGKLAKSSVHYTIRGVPAEVDHALRVKAAQRKQSLNRVVLDELTRALIGKPVKTDFSDLVGKWVPDPGFDKVIASQRQIDADKWK